MILIAVALAVIWTVRVQGQTVRFVHVTDPHLFDDGKDTEANKAALAAFIRKLNERTDERGDPLFAVITGDIGIENLVRRDEAPNGDTILETDPAIRDKRIAQGAAEMAAILSPSKIRVWLFVPGNNDLVNEQPDTQYYRAFIKKLKSLLPNLEITDLCPEDPKADKQELGVYRVGSSAFVGFNNSSFKNNNDGTRVAGYREMQLDFVRQVVTRLAPSDIQRAYVFYHIPELDDPYMVIDSGPGRPAASGNPFPLSSWFVDKDVHAAWQNDVVNNAKVRGLFAGHYHDWRRATYLDYHWMQTIGYSSGSLSKLYVSPPLAARLQPDKPAQARGFQEITIDGAGTIARKIWWFNPTNQSFDTEPSQRSNELELALFYEGRQEWQQAETHFTEAAKTAPSTALRNAALAGLARVRAAQYSWVKKALAVTDPMLMAPWVYRTFVVVAVALVLLISGIAIREGAKAILIHPFVGDDTLSKELAAVFPAANAKAHNTMASLTHDIFLPQSAQTVYPLVAPGRDQLFPQGTFELAGVKVPDLNVLLKWLIRPRFVVNGGIVSLGDSAFVYAQVWQRKTWFGLRFVSVVVREIPAGERHFKELEIFAFAVYFKAR